MHAVKDRGGNGSVNKLNPPRGLTELRQIVGQPTREGKPDPQATQLSTTSLAAAISEAVSAFSSTSTTSSVGTGSARHPHFGRDAVKDLPRRPIDAYLRFCEIDCPEIAAKLHLNHLTDYRLLVFVSEDTMENKLQFPLGISLALTHSVFAFGALQT